MDKLTETRKGFIIHRIRELCKLYSFQATPFGIVQHPLINMVMVFMKKGEAERFKVGKYQPFPDKEDSVAVVATAENLPQLCDVMLARMEQSMKEAWHFEMLTNKPYWIHVFIAIKDLLTEAEYNKILADIWTDMEFPHENGVMELLNLFKEAKPELLMCKKDYDAYKNLPKEMVIYRGIWGETPTIKGLSWTLSKEKAKWFSTRFEKDGKVYSATINKSRVFLYTDQRGEQELVLNPYYLKNLQEEAKR